MVKCGESIPTQTMSRQEGQRRSLEMRGRLGPLPHSRQSLSSGCHHNQAPPFHPIKALQECRGNFLRTDTIDSLTAKAVREACNLHDYKLPAPGHWVGNVGKRHTRVEAEEELQGAAWHGS